MGEKRPKAAGSHPGLVYPTEILTAVDMTGRPSSGPGLLRPCSGVTEALKEAPGTTHWVE